MAYPKQPFPEYSSGIFFISDLSTHTIQRCSKQFEMISGYTLPEMQDMGLDFYRAILHPDDFPNIFDARKKLETGEQPWYFGHSRIKGKNKTEWKWYSGFARSCTYDREGNAKEVFCSFHPLSNKSDTPGQTKEAFSEMLQAIHKEKIQLISPREKEVLSLVLKGDNEKMIAGKLHIAMRTVEAHLADLRHKLKVPNMASLVAKAKDMGL